MAATQVRARGRQAGAVGADTVGAPEEELEGLVAVPGGTFRGAAASSSSQAPHLVDGCGWVSSRRVLTLCAALGWLVAAVSLSAAPLRKWLRVRTFPVQTFPIMPASREALHFPSLASCGSLTPGTVYPDGFSGGNLSRSQSDGFFSESDEQWKMRRYTHIRQMCMQADATDYCRDGHRPCPWRCPAATEMPGYTCHAEASWLSHYEPTFSCAGEMRIGSQGDGGKWVCDPLRIAAKVARKEPCIVYSVGSNGDYTFESSVRTSISDACEIHTIDQSPWSNYTDKAPPDFVHYHVYRIGPAPDTPIAQVVKELGHEGKVIDIFKIDCEGCEWNTYKNWLDSGVYIRQILVELHADGEGKAGLDEFFRFLFDAGYVAFHKEPNTESPPPHCQEYAFIRLTREFVRAEQV